MRRFLLLLFVLLIGSSAFAQQNYVSRYDAFTGFSYLYSPKLNLDGRGFNGEFGVNVNRWLALGADFSIFDSHSSLFPKDLTPQLQQELAALLGTLPPGTIPPGYNLQVPFNATTYTFSAGPQINYRHFEKVTFFVRPALGLMHEAVTAKPSDPIQTGVVAALAPGGKISDSVVFYGAGGGFDINATKHVALRVGIDIVHVNLFDGFLASGRNSVRMSIGPAWRWGKNVK
jgi:hypothetical protein